MHVKREITDASTAPDQSALGVGLIDFIESILEKELMYAGGVRGGV